LVFWGVFMFCLVFGAFSGFSLGFFFGFLGFWFFFGFFYIWPEERVFTVFQFQEYF
jgi:hypothetical protein